MIPLQHAWSAYWKGRENIWSVDFEIRSSQHNQPAVQIVSTDSTGKYKILFAKAKILRWHWQLKSLFLAGEQSSD